MSDYRREWDEYRQLKRLYLRVWVIGSLALLIVFVISGVLLHNGLLAFFVAGPVVLICTYVQNKYLAFHCPRCRKPFDRRLRLLFSGFFASRCVHCGLPVNLG